MWRWSTLARFGSHAMFGPTDAPRTSSVCCIVLWACLCTRRVIPRQNDSPAHHLEHLLFRASLLCSSTEMMTSTGSTSSRPPFCAPGFTAVSHGPRAIANDALFTLVTGSRPRTSINTGMRTSADHFRPEYHCLRSVVWLRLVKALASASLVASSMWCPN